MKQLKTHTCWLSRLRKFARESGICNEEGLPMTDKEIQVEFTMSNTMNLYKEGLSPEEAFIEII
jgi:hypothetical protein